MSTAILLFSVISVLSLVKAAAFFALAAFDGAGRPARWFGWAFVAAATSFAGEIVLTTGFAPGPTRMVIAMAMVVMFVLIAYGMAERYAVPLPRAVGWAIIAASGLLYLLILDLPRADFQRQLLYQLPYALMSLLALLVILRANRKTAIDWMFVVLLALLALQFVAKPFLATWLGGVGASPSDYASTLYATVSLASGGLLLLVLATAALGVMIADSVTRLIQRHERDTETGLLNRGGFTNQAERALLQAASANACDCTLTLVALDRPARRRLDPSDVAALAQVLSRHTRPGALVGRMAQYDFAILTPGEKLFAARRTADALRAHFAAEPAATADSATLSVGITEREAGDLYSDLLARGLWALDEAQRAGGDCVRLSARSGLTVSGSGAA